MNCKFFSKIEKNKEKIQMLLMLIHHKLLSLYQDKNLISNLIVNYRKDLFSRRENDVLYWASMGRTYKEIASLLGITTSTVKFHIANVVKKLGVANAKQAICLSSELNLQQPVLAKI
nr:helix-turn-helix transcriptional regulator [Serratia sp. M24T3]